MSNLQQLVKKSLRLSSDYFDDEILSLMITAKREIERAGIIYDENNEMIQQAVVQFCKSRFGYDNKEAHRFERNFNEMLKSMSLSSDYCE